jgi:hypothetical protein
VRIHDPFPCSTAETRASGDETAITCPNSTDTTRARESLPRLISDEEPALNAVKASLASPVQHQTPGAPATVDGSRSTTIGWRRVGYE